MSPYKPGIPTRDLDHVITLTRGLWDELRDQRIFVTGGTGFVGTWLVESFVAANRELDLGARMVVLSRDPAAFYQHAPHLAEQSEISFCAGSMDQFDFPVDHFDCVIHAATSRVPGFGRLAAFDDDIQGTRRVLDFALSCGASRLLFTSSGAAYGPQPPEITHIPEEYLGAPATTDARSGYGQAKHVSEYLCAAYAQEFGLEVKIARLFAFVGPHLPLTAKYAIGNFICDAMAGGPIRIEGDGTPWRSYLYAADLAIWLWTILLRGVSGRIYNVGSDAALTIGDLAREVAAQLDPDVEISIALAPRPALPAPRYVPSIRRAREELGLQVAIDLADAIRRTAEWHRGSVSGAMA